MKKRFELDEELFNLVEFSAGSIALLLILIYNFKHTGSLLARHVTPEWYGYSAALGIEFSVVFLSAKLNKLKRQGRKLWRTLFPWSLILVVLLSATANLNEGFLTRYQTELSLQQIGQVDLIQLIVSVIGTLMVSLIVFALSEVISGDSKKVVQVVKHEVKTSAEETSKNANEVAGKPVKVQPTVPLTVEQRFVQLVKENPTATYRQIVSAGITENIGNVKNLAAKVGYAKDNGYWHNGLRPQTESEIH